MFIYEGREIIRCALRAPTFVYKVNADKKYIYHMRDDALTVWVGLWLNDIYRYKSKNLN